MKILSFLPLCVLLNLTGEALGIRIRTTSTTTVKGMLYGYETHLKLNTNPKKNIQIRTTDNPNYNGIEDPYVQNILKKHHDSRRANKLKKHEQKLKESMEGAAKQKRMQLNSQRLPERAGFLALAALERSKAERRRRKHKSTMLQAVKAKAAAQAHKSMSAAWKPNVTNHLLDVSRYKVKGLRLHKTDFDGRDYYSPYLANEFLIGELLTNLLHP
ncbi:hypothetical protein O0L34_g16915 [Tuta absoluta]|nr:hypothetical protein O0L34_g16915 [Tuta absoluta]